MQANWPRALKFNLAWEGGSAIRPAEPGGAVNKGVSLLAYQEWCERHGRAHPTVQDLMDISDEDVSAFYKERADQIGFDDLPSGYDLALFNASTMQGITGAKALHAKAKGDLAYLIILHMQIKMQSRPKFNPHTNKEEFYGPGWAARLVATYETAKELANVEA